MNRNLILLIILQAAASGVLAQAPSDADGSRDSSEKIRYQLILPEEKAPEVVKPTEPNPFTKGDVKTNKDDGATGEENRVREILASLPITGYVDDKVNGPRVLLGSFRLQRGDIVPKVLADQGVFLRVNSISRSQIDLIWQEKKKTSGIAPRLVTLPVRVDPWVRTALPTPPPPDQGKKATGQYDYQSAPVPQPGLAQDAPMESRRATLADDSSPAPGPAPADGKTVPADHPANLIMDYLFKAANKAVEAPAPAKPSEPPPPATPAAK